MTLISHIYPARTILSLMHSQDYVQLKHTPKEVEDIERANASIASLKINIEKFDVWTPVRQYTDEKHHDQYYINQGQVEKFKELHCSTTYNYAKQTQSGVFKHIPQDKYNIIELCHNYEV